MRRRPRTASATAVVIAALGGFILAGCGPPPPQAPTPQADLLSDALSMIAQDCGEASQATALTAHAPDLPAIDADARGRARELAGVFRRNPAWIYQGDTVRQLVALSADYLRECHLARAAADLVREAR
jgi:hypothetical protein